MQGLIQKEKVDIDGEKSAQISIAAKNIVTQRWLQIMVMGPEQAVHHNYFVVFPLLCSYYVTDIIKNWSWYLLVVKVLFKIEFGHAQISVPNIGKPIRKTVFINPWKWYLKIDKDCPYFATGLTKAVKVPIIAAHAAYWSRKFYFFRY